MYTGRFAFDMVQQHIDKTSSIEAKLWRVFVFSEYDVKSEKGRNSEALLQVHKMHSLTTFWKLSLGIYNHTYINALQLLRYLLACQ
jgi:hypothetical protein